MYKYLLFDLDGTLTDSLEGILNTLQYTLAQFGIEETDEDRMMSFIGPPLLESFEKHYGFSEPDLQRSLEIYRNHYRSKGMFQNKLYPNVNEVLTNIQSNGIKMAVATAKGEWTANQVVDRFELRSFFDFIAASDMKVKRNHKDQIIELALSKMNGMSKSEIAMIGDREHDIIGAQKNGIDSIAVTYGYGTIEELRAVKPTYFIDKLEDLLSLLG